MLKNKKKPPKPLKMPNLKKWYKMKESDDIYKYKILGYLSEDKMFHINGDWYNLKEFWKHYEELTELKEF